VTKEMRLKVLVSIAALLASSQAMAWGDLLGTVLQGAAQQAVSSAVQQAAQPAAPTQAPAYGQGVAPNQPYGVGGCVQNVPIGPPGTHADTDGNGCVTHLEYSNYVNYLANTAPQYLNGGAPGAAVPGTVHYGAVQPVQNGNAAAAVATAAATTLAVQQAQGVGGNPAAVGTAVQGLMGLFGQ
jgi:hypothetical protein